MVALFDALAHPTVSGKWQSKDLDASVEALLTAMHQSGFARACAVGLADLPDYSHERFAEMCAKAPELIPIAGVDPTKPTVQSELDLVASLGFRGIKLHPRRSQFRIGDPAFVHVLRGASERGLVVFLCTYFHEPVPRYPQCDPLYQVAAALSEVPECRMVLVHGGDVELMRYVQLARHSPSLLVDLSFTMMKYRGSSLDLDIKYLLKNFNRRLCIGTDHPEYGHAEVRVRFDELAVDLTDEERARVGYDNVERFLGLLPL